MQAFMRPLISSILVIFCLISAQQVRAELIAAKDGMKFAYLSPLRNGLSSVTLVWPMDPLRQGRVSALRAGLASVMSGGTSSNSSYEIDSFMRTKGIGYDISTIGRNLLLTVSAPDEVFPEALELLETLLIEPEYSRGWYERELQKIRVKNSSRTGRPSDVIGEVVHFLNFEPDTKARDESDGEFRFGQPSQAILRSGDENVEQRTAQLLNKLPKAKWEFPFGKWAKALIGADERPFALPAGTIHFAEPDSTEMLILLVKAEEFEDEGDQIGANLLVDYIGDNSGSEMFRVIRQKMRAAYDPRSYFVVMGKNKSVISLSATVEAERWPEIYGVMKEIYESTRAGTIESAGLKIQHERLHRSYFDHFFNNPVWGVQHYLNEFPQGTGSTINLPLFEALETAPLNEIVANSEAHLPPFDDFLLILIGGGAAPTEALKSKGYCALPKNTPLSFCFDVLSNVSN